MPTNSSSRAAPPRRSRRHSSTTSPLPLTGATDSGVFAIHDAVTDQHGEPWLRCGTSQASVWVRKADFLPNDPEVFRKLNRLNVFCLTRQSKEKIKQAVEACQPTRIEHVAIHSGWAGSTYVFGDGTVAPANPKPPIIVGIKRDSSQLPRGSLKGWQDGIGPIVRGQTIPLFLLGVSFCALLRRLAPVDYHNILIELEADGTAGKSILSAMACSPYRGNSEGDTGGGSSWDRTVISSDDLKLKFRDSLIALDEAQLAGKTERERNANIQQTVFKMFTTGTRSRFGDESPPEHSRFAFLSTTNTPLSEIVSGNKSLRDAALSRMITVTIDPKRPFGVLDSIPLGFVNTSEAMEDLRAAVDLNYGWPARAFVERLVQEISGDEEGFKAKLKKELSRTRGKLRANASSAVREEKSFALIAIAGRLARKWGVIPQNWGSISQACLRVQRDFTKSPVSRTTAHQTPIMEYRRRYQHAIVQLGTENLRLQPLEFENASGFLLGHGREQELIISTKRFRLEFPEHEKIVRSLRGEGLAKTEDGKSKKLSIKTPRSISRSGRAYCFKIGKFG